MTPVIEDPRFRPCRESGLVGDIIAAEMYSVYILKSELTSKYYIGCTNDLQRRLKEHNSGLSKFTKDKGPWIITYTEEFVTLSEARIRERKIKSWKKRVAIEKLIKA